MTDTDVDLSEFLKHSLPRKKPCSIATAAKTLKPLEREQLAAACAHDPGVITNGAVVRWLDVRGHAVSNNAVVVHRKGVCSCGRD